MLYFSNMSALSSNLLFVPDEEGKVDMFMGGALPHSETFRPDWKVEPTLHNAGGASIPLGKLTLSKDILVCVSAGRVKNWGSYDKWALSLRT